MGMHRDLGMRKFLQSTISSAEFIGIPTSNKFDKAVKYIHDNKSWKMCYVLIKVLFLCLRVLRLEDSTHSVMDKVYYYLRMTKQCIDKKISYIDHQELLPDLSSSGNICNMSDDRARA